MSNAGNKPGRQTRVQRKMRPSQINFTHGMISNQFRENRLGEKPYLETTFEDLLYGHKLVNEMPHVIVIELGQKENKKTWVLQGNRRLYIYKKLEEIGRINLISVYLQPPNEFAMKKFNRSHTTINGGESVVVRDRPDMDRRLQEIYEKWVEEGSPKDAIAPGTYVPSIHGSNGARRRHSYREKEELVGTVNAPLNRSGKCKVERLRKQFKEQLNVN